VKKLLIALIALIVLVVLTFGGYMLFIKQGSDTMCGSTSLISFLPKTMGDLEQIKILDISNACQGEETRLRGSFPKMTGFASTTYGSGREGGTYIVSVLQFANEADAKDVEDNLLQDAKHNREPILQSFGMNKVLWEMSSTSQGPIITDTFWKSNNKIVGINNQGNKNIDAGLVTSLLANYPSDNDIVLS
jgi:hypothetical protein